MALIFALWLLPTRWREMVRLVREESWRLVLLGLVMPVLKERGLTNKPYGQTLLVAAVIADFATMLLVSVYVILRTRGLSLEVLLVLLLFGAFATAYRVASMARRLSSSISGTVGRAVNHVEYGVPYTNAQDVILGTYAPMALAMLAASAYKAVNRIESATMDGLNKLMSAYQELSPKQRRAVRIAALSLLAAPLIAGCGSATGEPVPIQEPTDIYSSESTATPAATRTSQLTATYTTTATPTMEPTATTEPTNTPELTATNTRTPQESVYIECIKQRAPIVTVAFIDSKEGVPDIKTLVNPNLLHDCLGSEDPANGLTLWWQSQYPTPGESPFQDPTNPDITKIKEGEYLVPLSEDKAIIGKENAYLSPYSDPDRDGLPSLFEDKYWATDPEEPTSFEDLKNVRGASFVTLRVSHPFATKEGDPTQLDVEEINITPYQHVNPNNWKIEDGHATIEVVMFPNIEIEVNPRVVDSWPIDPNIYPPEVREYTETYADDVSAISPEIRETMLHIVNGTGEGYNTPAKTDEEAVQRIMQWNRDNITQMPNAYWGEYRYDYLPADWVSQEHEIQQVAGVRFREITNLLAPPLFEDRVTRACGTNATLLAAELRAVGIPVMYLHNVFTRCNPDLPECGLAGNNHVQNGVFIGGQWVIKDYQGDNNIRGDWSNENYQSFVFPDTSRDYNEPIWKPWFDLIDRGRGTWGNLFKPIFPDN